MKLGIVHWKTTGAAIAAVLIVVSKWPNIDQHDIESAVLAVGLVFAADASTQQKEQQ